MRRLNFFLAIYGLSLVALLYLAPPVVFRFLVSIFLLCGIVACLNEYKETIKDLKRELKVKAEREKSEKKGIVEEIDKSAGRISELLNREMTILSLYEITRRMSPELTFDGIFAVLSAFLKENFTFEKSELIVLKEAESYIRVDKAYKLYKEEDHKEEEAQTDYSDTLTLFTKDKKETYIPREGQKGFAAIPLLSENKFVGIITVEGLPRVDFERLVIVAAQFALEIKKVLLYETVEGLAITDSLTGRYTRRYFFERLNEELNRSKRYGFKFASLMIDIDDFKKCNDAHGHVVGDYILKEVARIIKDNVREIDLVARYGGEEFALILPETDKIGAFFAAERIRRKIEENVFKAYDEKLKVTVSVGLSIYPEDSEEPSDMIEKADRALYIAKARGKNIVCEYKV